jgi:hypothetical protein
LDHVFCPHRVLLSMVNQGIRSIENIEFRWFRFSAFRFLNENVRPPVEFNSASVKKSPIKW